MEQQGRSTSEKQEEENNGGNGPDGDEELVRLAASGRIRILVQLMLRDKRGSFVSTLRI